MSSVGQPLRREDVRTSMDHLFALGRYEDIRPVVAQRPRPASSCVFRLVPRFPINRVEVDCRDPDVSGERRSRTELRQRFGGSAAGVVRTEVVEDVGSGFLNDARLSEPGRRRRPRS